MAACGGLGLGAALHHGYPRQGAPAREGARIFSSADPAIAKPVGIVTSGTFSPWYVFAYRPLLLCAGVMSMLSVVCSLKAPIAMGYVPPALSEVGVPIGVEVRGKLQPATVAKLPFVPHQYFRG